MKNVSLCTKLNFSYAYTKKRELDINLFITKSQICYRSKLKFNLIAILKLISHKSKADSHTSG